MEEAWQSSALASCRVLNSLFHVRYPGGAAAGGTQPSQAQASQGISLRGARAGRWRPFKHRREQSRGALLVDGKERRISLLAHLGEKGPRPVISRRARPVAPKRQNAAKDFTSPKTPSANLRSTISANLFSARSRLWTDLCARLAFVNKPSVTSSNARHTCLGGISVFQIPTAPL